MSLGQKWGISRDERPARLVAHPLLYWTISV